MKFSLMFIWEINNISKSLKVKTLDLRIFFTETSDISLFFE